MEGEAQTHLGDCLELLQGMEPETVDLVYVDPPFFTQKIHDLVTRDGSKSFGFGDIWDSDRSYADFIYRRVASARDVLKSSGSMFVHCDKSASHIVRLMLDRIFSPGHFQSEIIWHFRRWSNSRKGLLPAHQTIFFYSKTDRFKFNTFYQEYSPSTNIDQIMQKRARDRRNKSVYARDESGKIIGNGLKKGVPLSDVWEIPFLNPKAGERVGYPTQKPVLLMNRIIELVTDEGDVVLDPFCGSGTTLVASQFLNRKSIGIDIAKDAIDLTRSRLENPVVTGSALLEKGKESYRQHDFCASSHLTGIDYIPVHRNKGIDGLLKQEIDGLPAFIRVQRDGENIGQAVAALKKAVKNKGDCSLVIIATCDDLSNYEVPSDVHLIPSTSFAITNLIKGRQSLPEDLFVKPDQEMAIALVS